VTLVDTGLNTKTAGRLKRVQQYIGNEEFMLTYGDGLSDIDLHALLKFHHAHSKIATLTAILPEGKFGGLEIQDSGVVDHFQEKPKGDGHWINGGFFVLKPEVFNYLNADTDNLMWEEQPLVDLTRDGQLMAFKHHGFWRCMDALRDKVQLEEMWVKEPKWKIWK
jgi:glucose-1-phosphate cytidylyltransferase